jgi:adenosine deaminase CECR1
MSCFRLGSLARDAAIDHEGGVLDYDKKRSRLVQQENDLAWDHGVKSSTNKIESDAARILEVLRRHEAMEVFGNQASEEVPPKHTQFMGGQFFTNKQRIEKESQLFQIARQAPKGALLHHHYNNELATERILEKARDARNLYVWSSRPLCQQQDLKEAEIMFETLDPDRVDPNVDIFSENYPGRDANWKNEGLKYSVFMSWEGFKNGFEMIFKQWKQDTYLEKSHCCSNPENSDNLSLAERWLQTKLVLNEEDAYGVAQTVNGYVFILS